MAMSGLQYVQTFFNFGSCILGATGFTTFLTFLYITRYSCSNDYSCNLYSAIQANTAFSFAIIFLPWIGCILAFMGKKKLSMIYSLIIFAITVSLIVCSAIILANSQIKDTWKMVRNNDQATLYAYQVNEMIVYNVAIAQVACIWFFLIGSAVLTPLTAKKQELSGTTINGDPLNK